MATLDTVSTTSATTVRTPKENARLWFLEVFANGKFELIDELIDPSYVSHDPSVPGGEWRGIEGARTFVALHRGPFSDLTVTIEDQIEEGEYIVTRWSARGTHTAPFAEIPATGRGISVTGINVKRVVDGRTVEEWLNFDLLGLLVQLGVIPASESTELPPRGYVETTGAAPAGLTDVREPARRWFEEVFNKGRVDLIETIFDRESIGHDPNTPGSEIAGLEGARWIVDTYKGAFPDVHAKVLLQIAEGEKVATLWEASGTHRGSLMGIPASGRSMRMRGVSIDRVVDGLIVENWVQYDLLGMMKQIGAIPDPAAN